MRRKIRKLLYTGLVAFFVVAALWMGGLYAFTRDLADAAPPAANDRPPADAVVVLTGGTNRLETGFDLLAQGLGRKLFISGVYRGVEVRELLERWQKEDKADLDCCVALGFEADNTYGNARETAEWMQREGLHSMYLITSNYHMKRAQLAFVVTAPQFYIMTWPVSPDGFNATEWWRDERYRWLIVREYSKYVAALTLAIVNTLIGF